MRGDLGAGIHWARVRDQTWHLLGTSLVFRKHSGVHGKHRSAHAERHRGRPSDTDRGRPSATSSPEDDPSSRAGAGDDTGFKRAWAPGGQTVLVSAIGSSTSRTGWVFQVTWRTSRDNKRFSQKFTRYNISTSGELKFSGFSTKQCDKMRCLRS